MAYNHKVWQILFQLFFLSLFLVFSIFLCHQLLLITTSFSHVTFFSKQGVKINIQKNNLSQTPCSSLTNNTICCDRTNYNSDICFMIGDVRTRSSSSSIFLYSSSNDTNLIPQEEKIKPYTRKWEGHLMDRIDELHLSTIHSPNASLPCDVHHDVPALFFSSGGYTGNVFHAFNNGLLPLYITSHHLQRQVVLMVLQYSNWWFTKYQEILAQLSEYTPIDFSNDSRTHCFPSAIVGLRFHGTLAVDPAQLSDNKSIADFHYMLDEAYKPRVQQIPLQNLNERSGKPPKLVIVSRKGTRVIENEGKVVHLGREIGFDVEVLKPESKMAMDRIYQSLSSCDVMMGVHGAALTHFLFMRPGSSMFIQIIPLGIEKLAWICFGEAAIRMGLRYEEYKILPRESSLYRKYGEDNPVVKDPNSMKKGRGWEITKEVYLEGQNITLDLSRLKKTLVAAFQYVVSKKRYQVPLQFGTFDLLN